MAIRFYDEALTYKLNRWMPESSKIRVLSPDESKKLFMLTADDTKDKPFRLPIISLSRNNDVELLLNIKNSRSFDGLKLYTEVDNKHDVAQWNIIPIKLVYQLDIYTKTADDCEEYMRNFLFKIINNPTMKIGIPYNGFNLQHIANIRVLNTVSETSGIPERLFSGQFHRWTIQLEIQDAFLFNVPYNKNWTIDGIALETYSDTNYTKDKYLEYDSDLDPQFKIEN